MVVVVCLGMSLLRLSVAQGAPPSSLPGPNAHTHLSALQTAIEQLRGQRFLRPVQGQSQSPQAFSQYLDRELAATYSAEALASYDTRVRLLGLYTGSPLRDPARLLKSVLQDQAAAYYDPAQQQFFVVLEDLPRSLLNSVYIHELYHAFQDQHFNLKTYYSDRLTDLNEDELLARQAVIEGEANYIMTLWLLQQQWGQLPSTNQLEPLFALQAQLSSAQLVQLSQGNLLLQGHSPTPNASPSGLDRAVRSLQDTPSFMLDTFLGAYQKGMYFIFKIQQSHGWNKVAELYRNPPVSTEQILHTDKWLKGEIPQKFEWPDLARNPKFKDWNFLSQNTLGELQWRTIFNQQGLPLEAEAAASGWDGDGYALWQHRQDPNRTLMLMTTQWDTVADAMEFQWAYERLLAMKYVGRRVPTLVRTEGRRVWIVEGGELGELEAWVMWLKSEVGSI